jgi:hypothetical protein
MQHLSSQRTSSSGFGRDLRLKPEDEKGQMAGSMQKGGVNS